MSLILDPHYKEVSEKLTDYKRSQIRLLRIPANLFALPDAKIEKVTVENVIIM